MKTTLLQCIVLVSFASAHLSAADMGWRSIKESLRDKVAAGMDHSAAFYRRHQYEITLTVASAVAGAATCAATGARVGAGVGIVCGPATGVSGCMAGTVLGATVGAVTGGLAGSRIGHQLDMANR